MFMARPVYSENHAKQRGNLSTCLLVLGHTITNKHLSKIPKVSVNTEHCFTETQTSSNNLLFPRPLFKQLFLKILQYNMKNTQFCQLK